MNHKAVNANAIDDRSGQSKLTSRPVNKEIREANLLNERLGHETTGMGWEQKQDYILYHKMIASGANISDANAAVAANRVRRDVARQEQQNQATKFQLNKIQKDVKTIKHELQFP